jgi:FkbM family methyltransferase
VTPLQETPAARRIRRVGRRLAHRIGLEDQAVRGYERLLRALETPMQRQNRRDDERVRLLAAALLSTDSNCIDIGANEGQLLAMFTELAPDGRHIAYEPVPSLARELVRRFPQVDVRPAAVSDGTGESWFVVNRELPSRSSLRPVGNGHSSTERIRVPVESLDSSLPADYVPHLVKVDVEGAELLVLRGARRVLREHKPVIVFEHQRRTASWYGSRPAEVFALLVDELDMRIFDLDGGGPYSRLDFERAYEAGTHWNFFAVPAHGPA